MPDKLSRHKHTLRTAFKIVAWTIMAALLVPAALTICMLRVLTPDNLTPLVTRVANELLDADVSVGRVELSFAYTFPMLHLEVDSVTVLSKPVMQAPDSLRRDFPAWADTLLTISHFQGGINLVSLAAGDVRLHNVEFVEPELNLFPANDSLANYWIYTAPADTAKTDTKVPHIYINKFALTRPRPLRFANLATHQHTDDETIARIYHHIRNNISPQARRVIELRFAEGLPFARIAATMGISETAVYRHLSNALKIIRKKLNENG